jgi:UDP-N-acetylglucosamine diphosphorylase/glucosamine-1-phosphate N-acetyltransferase
MRLCIYEDATFDCFYPLTYLRAIFDLRCGATSLAEKIQRAAPGAETCFFARDLLTDVLRERQDAPVNDPSKLQGDDLLLVNPRWLLLDPADLPAEGPEEIIEAKGVVLAARVSQATAGRIAADSPQALLDELDLPRRQVEATVLSYFWELIHHNPDAIVADFRIAGKSGIQGTFSDHAAVWGPEDQVYVAPTAEVQPFVCLDTSGGPVTIDEGAVINPQTRIEGPAYIGPKAMIVGGKIREGCSIGPVCRVGGEVEESIIHGYSNKYHDGFLGHAYVCEWVNLGALTTNSDLKNDYTAVQAYLKGELVDTDDTKVGSFIGDHTKTSIGTILNTGTVVGVMTNVMASGGVTPKFIPSFTMFLDNKMYNIPFKKTLGTAQTAMGRRGRELTEAEAALLDATRGITKEVRSDLVRRSRKQLARERGMA